VQLAVLVGERGTFGVDGAGVLLIEHVEDVLYFEDVGLVEAGTLVGACVKLGLCGRLLIGSAHATIKYYEGSILFHGDKI
jgi:hypothetical protein